MLLSLAGGPPLPEPIPWYCRDDVLVGGEMVGEEDVEPFTEEGLSEEEVASLSPAGEDSERLPCVCSTSPSTSWSAADILDVAPASVLAVRSVPSSAARATACVRAKEARRPGMVVRQAATRASGDSNARIGGPRFSRAHAGHGAKSASFSRPSGVTL